ncbi:MAG: hypothetical protein GXY76_04065 [Chloroflexi bacterium]|nr:hypothetical protein [Chloroflexota bacterium]
MSILSRFAYREGSAVVAGFVAGLAIGVLAANLAFGLCLGVGLGAVVDGAMRLWRGQQAAR